MLVALAMVAYPNPGRNVTVHPILHEMGTNGMLRSGSLREGDVVGVLNIQRHSSLGTSRHRWPQETTQSRRGSQS